MAHKELASKTDFEEALQTKDRYVCILAYEGEFPSQADENAKKFESAADAYAVEVGRHQMAKQFLNITNTPALLVFRDGAEVTRIDDMSDHEKMQEVTALMA